MPKLVPSQVAAAIDQLFGAGRNELDERGLSYVKRAEVHALLVLLDQIPDELIDLPINDYLEFVRCRGRLSTELARWNVGDHQDIQPRFVKDPVERIRRLLLACPDRLPEPELDIPFVNDPEIRRGIQERINGAWTNYLAREWLAATVLAGAALEALLLWALKRAKPDDPYNADKLHLGDLIRKARAENLISEPTQTKAQLAQDARNLVHPGRVAATGIDCDKSSSLSALAAVFAVIRDMRPET